MYIFVKNIVNSNYDFGKNVQPMYFYIVIGYTTIMFAYLGYFSANILLLVLFIELTLNLVFMDIVVILTMLTIIFSKFFKKPMSTSLIHVSLFNAIFVITHQLYIFKNADLVSNYPNAGL